MSSLPRMVTMPLLRFEGFWLLTTNLPRPLTDEPRAFNRTETFTCPPNCSLSGVNVTAPVAKLATPPRQPASPLKMAAAPAVPVGPTKISIAPRSPWFLPAVTRRFR